MRREDPAPAGWYPDHFRQFTRHRLRYWDGCGFTQWVADGAEPYLERERKISFDRSALRHPFWTSVAYGIFYLLVVTAAVALGGRGSIDLRPFVITNAFGAAIVAPWVVFLTRRRLRKPPRIRPAATP